MYYMWMMKAILESDTEPDVFKAFEVAGVKAVDRRIFQWIGVDFTASEEFRIIYVRYSEIDRQTCCGQGRNLGLAVSDCNRWREEPASMFTMSNPTGWSPAQCLTMIMSSFGSYEPVNCTGDVGSGIMMIHPPGIEFDGTQTLREIMRDTKEARQLARSEMEDIKALNLASRN